MRPKALGGSSSTAGGSRIIGGNSVVVSSGNGDGMSRTFSGSHLDGGMGAGFGRNHGRSGSGSGNLANSSSGNGGGGSGGSSGGGIGAGSGDVTLNERTPVLPNFQGGAGDSSGGAPVIYGKWDLLDQLKAAHSGDEEAATAAKEVGSSLELAPFPRSSASSSEARTVQGARKPWNRAIVFSGRAGAATGAKTGVTVGGGGGGVGGGGAAAAAMPVQQTARGGKKRVV